MAAVVVFVDVDLGEEGLVEQASGGVVGLEVGSAQWAWLTSTVDPVLLREDVTVHLIIAGKAFLGDAMDPVCESQDQGAMKEYNKMRDKVWMYDQFRTDFGTFVSENGLQVVWMGGDRHSVAWDSGATHNSWGKFPCMIGSGWAEHTNANVAGEIYDYQYPAFSTEDPDPEHPTYTYQYLRGTITDYSSGQVDLATEIRYQNPTTLEMDTFAGGDDLKITFRPPS